MKQNIVNVGTAFKGVYSLKKSYVLTMLTSIVIYWFNVLIKNYRLILDNFNLRLIWKMIIGSVSAMPLSAYLFLSLISILTGITVTFAWYVVKRQVTMSAGTGFLGVVAGVVAPGCASCALGFFSILGLGGFVSILPFKGVELGAIGLMLLVVSIFVLSKKVNTKVCKI